jgi:hypothetical protein
MSVTPSSNEQEYFAREEAARLRKAAEERDKKLKTAEKEQQKKLHWMKCPKDGMDLVEIELAGVKVDKCFTCEGVFFDAGELESVVKKEAGFIGRLNSVFGRGK